MAHAGPNEPAWVNLNLVTFSQSQHLVITLSYWMPVSCYNWKTFLCTRMLHFSTDYLHMSKYSLFGQYSCNFKISLNCAELHSFQFVPIKSKGEIGQLMLRITVQRGAYSVAAIHPPNWYRCLDAFTLNMRFNVSTLSSKEFLEKLQWTSIHVAYPFQLRIQTRSCDSYGLATIGTWLSNA